MAVESRAELVARLKAEMDAKLRELDERTRADHDAHWSAGCPREDQS